MRLLGREQARSGLDVGERGDHAGVKNLNHGRVRKRYFELDDDHARAPVQS
jgi:hypothetical protein